MELLADGGSFHARDGGFLEDVILDVDEPAVAVEFPAFITRESVGPGFSRVRPGVDEDGVAGSSLLSVKLRKEAPAIGRRQRGDARGFGYSRYEIAELDKRL